MRSIRLPKRLLQKNLLILFCFALLFSPFLTAFAEGTDGVDVNESGKNTSTLSEEKLDDEESNGSKGENANLDRGVNVNGSQEETKKSELTEEAGVVTEDPKLVDNDAGICSDEFTNPVDLYAGLDIPSNPSSDGPKILENKGVMPGSDIELDKSHLVENPSYWNGAVQVDINPTDQTISIAVADIEDYNDYEYVRVEISTEEIGAIHLIEDGLAEDYPISDYGIESGKVYFEWLKEDDVFYLTGETVFSYEHRTCAEITVQYVDEDGNKIADDVTVEGEIGSYYLFEPKHFEGYTLVRLPENYEGQYEEVNEPVIFVYAKHVEQMCPLEEVDIRVELSWGDEGKRVFERKGVVPGVGVELDASDLIEETGHMNAALLVDIDPDIERIGITGTSEAQVDFMRVEIKTDQIESIKLIEDRMFHLYDEDYIDFSSGIENGVVYMEWTGVDEPFMILPAEMLAYIHFGYSLKECEVEEPPPLACPLDALDVYAGVRSMEIYQYVKEYERLQVVPSLGPELTIADELDDSWAPGDFEVDINPYTKEITITDRGGEASVGFLEFFVKIDTDQITSIGEIENTLAERDFEFEYSIEDGVILFQWTALDDSYFNLTSNGKLVFSFEQVGCEEPEEPKEPEDPEEPTPPEEPEKPEEPEEPKEEKDPIIGKPLPKTATPYYTFMFIGVLLLLIGGGTYFAVRKRKMM